IAAAVAAVAGPIVSVVAPAHPDEAAATLADTRRCAALLGFVPTSDLPGLVARQWLACSPRPSVPRTRCGTVPPAPPDPSVPGSPPGTVSRTPDLVEAV
ncbi:MAG TPA: hypothetical protein VHF25_09560, partial [Nitriliruptorales bacterium]|nr:hypothetical protein [Nitriliruptorales bacterium]